MNITIFALIPLILSIGIAPAIPFSDGVEYDQICIDKVWIENSKGEITLEEYEKIKSKLY